MKASELRIGNFVSNPPLSEFRIIDYLDIRDHAENRLIQPFEPIPLTEGWLIKFGFIYHENLFGLKMPLPEGHVRFTSPRWVTRNLIGDLIETPFLRFDAIHTDIYFVHSLQNLWFAITGEELKIREN